MDFSAVYVTLIVIGCLGLFVGLFLGVAAIIFKVKVNEQEVKVLELLPGSNCGGCGYPGCAGYADAIANHGAEVNLCTAANDEMVSKIAAIMGTEAKARDRQVAFVACKAHCADITTDYDYYGVEDCRMLSFVPNGGPKSCNDGCLGYGTCVKACPFDAIHVEDGVAKVDREKCKACGKCVAVCPKHLISLIPYNAQYTVSCSSKQKGPVTTKQCKVGCVGCGLCVKNCPNEAVKVENFNATIDYDKCKNCGVCKEKCPRKTIESQF